VYVFVALVFQIKVMRRIKLSVVCLTLLLPDQVFMFLLGRVQKENVSLVLSFRDGLFDVLVGYVLDDRGNRFQLRKRTR
jgi:hypothetical protein